MLSPRIGMGVAAFVLFMGGFVVGFFVRPTTVRAESSARVSSLPPQTESPPSERASAGTAARYLKVPELLREQARVVPSGVFVECDAGPCVKVFVKAGIPEEKLDQIPDIRGVWQQIQGPHRMEFSDSEAVRFYIMGAETASYSVKWEYKDDGWHGGLTLQTKQSEPQIVQFYISMDETGRLHARPVIRAAIEIYERVP